MIDEIRKCPHCGSTGFYVKQRIFGYGEYYVDTTGKEMDNSGIHSRLDYKDVGKYAYCADCDKRFARISDLEDEQYL